MTTLTAVRQNQRGLLYILVGTIAFVALLLATGAMGHILSLFNISYADAVTVVNSLLNNGISALPGYLQPIANTLQATFQQLYNSLGLQNTIAY